jgi:hypothetical protein
VLDVIVVVPFVEVVVNGNKVNVPEVVVVLDVIVVVPFVVVVVDVNDVSVFVPEVVVVVEVIIVVPFVVVAVDVINDVTVLVVVELRVTTGMYGTTNVACLVGLER